MNDLNENGEGTLTKCKCGNEFFLSFENGFLCGNCKLKASKVHAHKLKKYLGDENIKIMAREIDARLQRKKHKDNPSNNDCE